MKQMQLVYFIRFCSNFCQAAFFPFFAVWLFKEKLFSAGEAAFIVSLGIFSTRLSAILFSSLVRKYHKKYIIISSLTCISILYGIFYLFATREISNLVAWITLSILLGGLLSLNSLALLSYIATHNDEKQHHAGFSYINIALNLSSGLGPFLGAIILSHHTRFFPLVPILFSFTSMLACFWLTKDNITSTRSLTDEKFSFGGNKYIFFILLNILTFIGYSQFYDVFPVYAMHQMSEKNIGLLFIISSVVIVLSQIPISNFITTLSARTSILLSNLILAIGTLMFIPATDNGFAICAMGVVFISLAEVAYAPLYQTLAIRLFESKNSILSLAIQSFSWGIAEAFATFIGIYTAGHGYGYVSIILGAIAALFVSGICFIKSPKLVVYQA